MIESEEEDTEHHVSGRTTDGRWPRMLCTLKRMRRSRVHGEDDMGGQTYGAFFTTYPQS